MPRVLAAAILLALQVGGRGGAPVALTDQVIARIPTGRAEGALSPGCPDIGEDAASECPPAFVFRGRGDDLMAWDGPHGNLKRIAVTPDSARLAAVIPGPALSWSSEIPFDGRVEDDGTIELVTDRQTVTGGRYWVYSHHPGFRRWTGAALDSAQVDPPLRTPGRSGTDGRLVPGDAGLALRRIARRPFASMLEASVVKAALVSEGPGGHTLETGEGDTIACRDGSVLVLRWSERALVIHRVNGAGR